MNMNMEMDSSAANSTTASRSQSPPYPVSSLVKSTSAASATSPNGSTHSLPNHSIYAPLHRTKAISASPPLSVHTKFIYSSKKHTDTGTPKPDFAVRRNPKSHKTKSVKVKSHHHHHQHHHHPDNRRRVFSNGFTKTSAVNSSSDNKPPSKPTEPYFNGTEYDTEASMDMDTDTEIPYDALKYAANGNNTSGGYLSDGTALLNVNNYKNNKHTAHSHQMAKKRRIKRHFGNHAAANEPSEDLDVPMQIAPALMTSKSANSPSRSKPKRIMTSMDEHDEVSAKQAISTSIDKFNRKKHRKKQSKMKIQKKRWSVSHTDSSTIGQLKSRYNSDGKKKKIGSGLSKGAGDLSAAHSVKWHRSTSIEKDSYLPSRGKKPKKRRSIFNQNHAMTPMLPTDDTAFETINSQKWDIEQLMSVETEDEFQRTLSSHSKEDIIELCWDLLRSKDKSDDLLRMVSLMNTDLNAEKAYDTMMTTIKQTLDCKFASLYAIEEESFYLKCLWTSAGEPEKDIYVSITNSTQLPARVFQKSDSITRSLTQNTEQICPDFEGFGNVYVMGVPILDNSKNGEKMGVLMMYRDRSKADMFDDRDLHSAQMLCNIAASTLRNVSLFNAANEKEKHSRQILSIIDEMSGDVSEGYGNIIKKIVRKVRSLVTCTRIDFWRVDFERNLLRCEVSHNPQLQDLVIPRDDSHVIGACALTGKCVKIDNSRLDTRYNAEQLKYSQGESILIIPVRVEQSDPIGVIVAINKSPKTKKFNRYQPVQCIPFNNDDRRLLETFATSASITIKNSLLFGRIADLNRKHESMVSILRALQEKHNVTHMLSQATMAVREALEAERVSLWFEDGEGNLDALEIGNLGNEDDMKLMNSSYESLHGGMNGTDVGNHDGDEIVQSIFAAIARHCAEDRMLINTPSLIEDEELWNAITDFIEFNALNSLNQNHWFWRRGCSVLCVPILSNDSVVGVIQAIYKKGSYGFGFTETDQQIVESVSSEVAHTLARNISDLTLQKYVNKHDDIPLEIIEYYLTGSLDQQPKFAKRPSSSMTPNPGTQPQGSYEGVVDENTEQEFIGNFKEQQQMVRAKSATPQPGDDKDDGGFNVYTVFSLDDRLKSYCEILPTCQFDATQFDIQQDLEQFVMFAIDEYGLIEEFKLNIPKLTQFIHSVAKLYRGNPFHNWQHGFFVFHFVLYFIKKQANIIDVLSRQHLLAILIAGLCHDVDHPGTDNLFQIEADTDLARIYNGLSVLENHHTYTTLSLLRKPELNFFEGSTLEKKDVKDIKQIITKSIMATDMSHHSEAIQWLNDFVKERVIEGSLRDPKFAEAKKDAIRTKICQCVVHLGDLSAQTYPWRIAKEWERRIAREFKQQTVNETKLGIPIRDFMAKTDIQSRYKSQFFFVNHVVKPLWEPAAALFPDAAEERLTTLKSNAQKYIEIAKKKETKD